MAKLIEAGEREATEVLMRIIVSGGGKGTLGNYRHGKLNFNCTVGDV